MRSLGKHDISKANLQFLLKKCNKVKNVIGILPNGAAAYCSAAYPGSFSDKKIVEHCGILNLLQPGDMILADKGFKIEEMLPSGVSCNIPPFLETPQSTSDEIARGRSIAKARVHIERLNERMKKYRILQLIPKCFFSCTTMMVQTCVGLINFQAPLLKCMANDFHGGIFSAHDCRAVVSKSYRWSTTTKMPVVRLKYFDCHKI